MFGNDKPTWEWDRFDDTDDWLPDEADIRTVCPNCGSDDYVYAGEAFDDDEYLGSSYDCNECGRSFTMNDAEEY